MKLKTILKELGSLGQNQRVGLPKRGVEPNLGGVKGSIKSISDYNAYGAELKRDIPLPEISKKIKSAVEAAANMAIDGIPDEEWFDRKTLERNLLEIQKYMVEFEKISNEIYSKEKRLEALYDDIGFRLSRYYDIK